MKQQILAFICSLLLLLPVVAEAAADNRFENLTAYDDNGGLRLVFRFQKEAEPQLSMLKGAAQLEVKSAFVEPAKKRFSLDREGISEVRVYQMDKDTLRIRLIPTDLEKGMESLAGRFALATEGNRIVVKLLPVTAPVATTNAAAAAPQEDIKNDHNTQNVAVEETAEEASNIPTSSENVKNLTDGFLTGNGFVGQAEAADTAEASTSAEAASGSAEAASNEELGFLNYQEPTAPEIPSVGSSIVKVISALAIVLGLVLLLGRFAKKHFEGMEGRLGGRKDIQILSTHAIGVKKQVTLLEVGGEVLLVGVTNNSINLLNRYTDPEKIEQIKLGTRLPKKAAAEAKLKEQAAKQMESAQRKAEKSKLISQMARDLAAKVQQAQAAGAVG